MVGCWIHGTPACTDDRRRDDERELGRVTRAEGDRLGGDRDQEPGAEGDREARPAEPTTASELNVALPVASVEAVPPVTDPPVTPAVMAAAGLGHVVPEGVLQLDDRLGLERNSRTGRSTTAG